ncbi:MAG: hypothetical protein M3P51_15385, partial [Chloroflexota bacterium]|nr:hypothetical protein [Chloroflexota bacterium]
MLHPVPHRARPRSSPPVPPCDPDWGERSAPSARLEALIRAYPSSAWARGEQYQSPAGFMVRK